MFVVMRDPRALPDHGRMQVVRTALDALSQRFELVDVFTARPASTTSTEMPENIRIHPLEWSGIPTRLVGATRAFVAGRGSLNAAMGVDPAQISVIRRSLASTPDFVLLDGVRSSPLREAFAGVPVLTDLDDLLSARYRNWAELPFSKLPYDIVGTVPESPINRVARLSTGLLPALLRYEANRVERLEETVCATSDAVSLVSTSEAEALRAGVGRSVFALPMSVADPGTCVSRSEPPVFDAVFLGHVTHLSNLAGLRFLAEDVLPLLAQRLGRPPRVAVVGRVTESVRTWLEVRGLEPVGFVDDLQRIFAVSRCAVAPQVVAGGLNTKILDYARLRIPIVGTPQAFAGFAEPARLPWVPAATPAEFAGQLHRAQDDPAVDAAVDAGAVYVQQHYAVDVVRQKWIEAFEETMNRQEAS